MEFTLMLKGNKGVVMGRGSGREVHFEPNTKYESKTRKDSYIIDVDGRKISISETAKSSIFNHVNTCACCLKEFTSEGFSTTCPVCEEEFTKNYSESYDHKGVLKDAEQVISDYSKKVEEME